MTTYEGTRLLKRLAALDLGNEQPGHALSSWLASGAAEARGLGEAIQALGGQAAAAEEYRRARRWAAVDKFRRLAIADLRQGNPIEPGGDVTRHVMIAADPALQSALKSLGGAAANRTYHDHVASARSAMDHTYGDPTHIAPPR